VAVAGSAAAGTEIDPALGMRCLPEFIGAAGLPPKRAGRLLCSSFLTAVLLLFLAGCERSGVEALPEAPPGTDVGQLAPELVGTAPSGEAFARDQTRGWRTVVLFYQSETCGLCRRRLEQLHTNLSAYEAVRARVVAVTLDPPELAARTAERLGGELSIVSVDPAVFDAWDVLEEGRSAPLPGAYILDDRGVVIYRHLGVHAGDRISDAMLLSVLETASR
jgi:peroxiredoxin